MQISVTDASACSKLAEQLERERNLRVQAESDKIKLQVQVEVLRRQLRTVAARTEPRAHRPHAARPAVGAGASSATPAPSVSLPLGAFAFRPLVHAGACSVPPNSRGGPAHARPPFYHQHDQHRPPGRSTFPRPGGEGADEGGPAQDALTLEFMRDTEAARVVQFSNEPHPTLLVSTVVPNGARHGVARVSLADPRHNQTIALHAQQIRGLRSSRLNPALVLTTSFDKTLKVFNLKTNNVVLECALPSCGWSCDWSSSCEHQVFVGLPGGTMCAFDMRRPSQCLYRVTIPGCRHPVHSVAHVQPTATLANNASPDGVVMCGAVCGIWRCTAGADENVELTDLLPGKCVSLASGCSDGNAQPLCVASSRGGPSAAAHAVFDPFAAQPPAVLRGHSSERNMSRACVWRDSGAGMFVASGDEQSRKGLIWDCQSGSVVHRTCEEHPKPILMADHLADGASHCGLLAFVSETRVTVHRHGAACSTTACSHVAAEHHQPNAVAMETATAAAAGVDQDLGALSVGLCC